MSITINGKSVILNDQVKIYGEGVIDVDGPFPFRFTIVPGGTPANIDVQLQSNRLDVSLTGFALGDHVHKTFTYDLTSGQTFRVLIEARRAADFDRPVYQLLWTVYGE